MSIVRLPRSMAHLRSLGVVAGDRPVDAVGVFPEARGDDLGLEAVVVEQLLDLLGLLLAVGRRRTRRARRRRRGTARRRSRASCRACSFAANSPLGADRRAERVGPGVQVPRPGRKLEVAPSGSTWGSWQMWYRGGGEGARGGGRGDGEQGSGSGGEGEQGSRGAGASGPAARTNVSRLPFPPSPAAPLLPTSPLPTLSNNDTSASPSPLPARSSSGGSG